METTRHFTATAYVVHDGSTVLHRHPRLELWLPPGGHVQRDELPHDAAIREVREETGLHVELVQSAAGTSSDTVRPLPTPATLLLEDINTHDGAIGHQHIDFVYYASASEAHVEPGEGEVTASRWEWFPLDALRADDRLEPDVRKRAIEAIQAVSSG